MDLVGSRDRLVAHLKTAQLKGKPLRVVTDLGKVNPPCAFVQLDNVDHYLAGGEVLWRAYLVADNTDQTRVIQDLEGLLNAVLEIGTSPAAATEYVGLQVPEQSQALPAFLVRITETI